MEQDLHDIIASHPLELNCTSFDFVEVSDANVIKVMQDMKSKSSGVDGISVRIIKLICPIVISCTTVVINASMRDGCSSMLEAQLPEISKIHEKIVFMQLLNFLEINHILDSLHARYRSGYSPQTALLAVTKDAREALDYDMITILV